MAVEFALVVMLLVPLSFGLIDYGQLWQKRQVAEGASRAAARRAATTCLVTNDPANDCDAGNRPSDDYDVLLAARASLGDAIGEVESIVVYRVPKFNDLDDPPDGTTPAITNGLPISSCRTATTTGGTPGRCNVYGPEVLAMLDTITPPLKASMFSCTAGGAGVGLSRYYCPTDRNRSVSGASSIGVYIRLRHPHITGMFGKAATVADYTVFRLEPNPSAVSVTEETTTTTTTTTIAPATSSTSSTTTTTTTTTIYAGPPTTVTTTTTTIAAPTLPPSTLPHVTKPCC